MIQKEYMDNIVDEIAKKLSKETGFTFEDVKTLYVHMFYDDVREEKMGLGRSMDATKTMLQTIMIMGGTVGDYIKTM